MVFFLRIVKFSFHLHGLHPLILAVLILDTGPGVDSDDLGLEPLGVAVQQQLGSLLLSLSPAGLLSSPDS